MDEYNIKYFYTVCIHKIGTCEYNFHQVYETINDVINMIQNLCEIFCVQLLSDIEIHKISLDSVYKCKLSKSFYETIDHEQDFDCCNNIEQVKNLCENDFTYTLSNTYDIKKFIIDIIEHDDYDDVGGIAGNLQEICDVLNKNIFMDEFIKIMIYEDHSLYVIDVNIKIHEIMERLIRDNIFRNKYNEIRRELINKINSK